MSSSRNFIKLCWLITGDKVSGTHKTQAYLDSAIRTPIVEPCRRGAKIYGCDVDSKAFGAALREVSRDTAKGTAFATGGLALEAVFIRSTLASLHSVLGAVVGRLAKTYGSGAVCAVADGPLPIGDLIGLALAVVEDTAINGAIHVGVVLNDHLLFFSHLHRQRRGERTDTRSLHCPGRRRNAPETHRPRISYT